MVNITFQFVFATFAMQNIIKSFTKLDYYSVDLARLAGVEESALLFNLIRSYGTTEFNKSKIGWIWKAECFNNLINLSLITQNGLFYSVNYSKLEEILTPKEEKLPETIPTFSDPKFIAFCHQWRVILRDKHRGKTMKEIYSLFENKTLDQSIESLLYAINNKHVTLFFNENTKGTTKGTGDSGRARSGGEQNSGETGSKDHLVRRPDGL